MIIPTNLVSSSAAVRFDRHVGVDIVPPVVGTAACTSVIVTLSHHRQQMVEDLMALSPIARREGHLR